MEMIIKMIQKSFKFIAYSKHVVCWELPVAG